MAQTIPGPHVDVPAPRLARLITVFCLGAVALLAVVNVLAENVGVILLVTSLGCVTVVFLLQYLHCSPAARAWSTRAKTATLAVQAVFTYLPMAVFGIGWGGMAGCLAASVLLAVGGRAAWVLFFLVSASMAGFPPLLGATFAQTVYVTVSTMLIGLVLYGLARLSDLVYEVHAARNELARLAIAEERLRFARDLHDLLGYSLSAVSLKSELIYRLVLPRPERAREEVASILQITRQALADLRLVASGYRDMSLLDEVASARSILTAADIDVEVTTADVNLHPVVDTILATSLREGVTNILRHSRARHCEIAVGAGDGAVRLTMVNDGLPEDPGARAPHSGSGLGNIRSRLAEIGGRLDARACDDHRFQLVVEAPTDPGHDAYQQRNAEEGQAVPAGAAA